MPNSIKIISKKCLQGISANLNEKTALISIEFDEEIKDWGQFETNIVDCFSSHPALKNLTSKNILEFLSPFFCNRVVETNIAIWVAGLTVALQHEAREVVSKAQGVLVSNTRIHLALPWDREEVMTGALRVVLEHVLICSQPQRADLISQSQKIISDFLTSAGNGAITPSTYRFAQAAIQRNIPVQNYFGTLFLGSGIYQRKFNSSITEKTSYLGVVVSKNKFQTNQLLKVAGFPIALAYPVGTADLAIKFANQIGWPVVIKPASLDMGIGVVANIQDEKALRTAFENAWKLGSGNVVLEKHVYGNDYRLLVVGGKLTAAAMRTPAGVVGDGTSTVQELISRENANPLRGVSKRSMLIALALDEEALDCLRAEQLSPNSIPVIGQHVRLRSIANISTGGTATDVMTILHPDNQLLAERAARLLNLDIAGIDLICPDISRSWKQVGGAICEVNSQPGLRVHWLATPDRDINGEIIDWAFDGGPASIPTAAITGTNGKTTTAKMLHHIWRTYGKNAGVCTTQGTWAGDEKIQDKNFSGFPGATALLLDTKIEAAVFEMPRKGLIYFGHPCHSYDVGAILNIQDDHIGDDGIVSLEAMAKLKAEVYLRSRKAIVVNADDEYCLAMRQFARVEKHILVARQITNPVLVEHLANGGCGISLELIDAIAWIVIYDKNRRELLMPLGEVSSSMCGLLLFNETNALFAAALAYAHEIPVGVIRKALVSFRNSLEQNTGRYNFIEGYPHQVLLDYAHNPEGIKGLCEVVDKIEAKRKIAVCLHVGNRIAKHIPESAKLLAKTFDQLILGCHPNLVKKCLDYTSDDPVKAMLAHFSKSVLNVGFNPNNLYCQADPKLAIANGLAMSESGDLLVILSEPELVLPILNLGT